MKWKLIHPLWVHIPAVLTLVVAAGFLLASLPLPERVPVHFGLSGEPDRWGSPWEVVITLFGLGLLYIGLSILGDELWARQEKRKTFNWMSLLDEAVVGFLAGNFIAYSIYLRQMSGTYTLPWATPGAVAGGAVLAAIVLELIRPYRPFEQRVIPEDTSTLEREIGEMTEEGKSWVYWDVQNPRWMNWVVVITTLILAGGAVVTFPESPLAALPPVFFAIVVASFYGGLRTSVTPDRLEVRIGLSGIRFLKLRISDITSAEVYTFSPLREFGGYGIRFNLRMKAYYFRGNRGVLITTAQGKKYLIGSDHPERLASVLQVAMRYAG